MTPRPVALALLTAAALSGCGSSDAKPASTPTAAAKAPAPAGCRTVAAPRPKGEQHLKAATARVPPGTTVTLQTNCGAIVIALATTRAPKTDAAFAGLVRQGFYDGLTFHRIVPGFVVQGGDPLGNGQGGPGYTVVEKPPSSLRYSTGVVAMAKTASDPAGASGSQFFIVTGADAGLPPDYALVGRVVRGMAAVKAIEAVPADAQGMPSTPVVIQKATLRTG
ncbi:MAG: peptidylprolyl isomerase [Solirubrobacteraceae bacterium]